MCKCLVCMSSSPCFRFRSVVWVASVSFSFTLSLCTFLNIFIVSRMVSPNAILHRHHRHRHRDHHGRRHHEFLIPFTGTIVQLMTSQRFCYLIHLVPFFRLAHLFSSSFWPFVLLICVSTHLSTTITLLWIICSWIYCTHQDSSFERMRYNANKWTKKKQKKCHE